MVLGWRAKGWEFDSGSWQSLGERGGSVISLAGLCGLGSLAREFSLGITPELHLAHGNLPFFNHLSSTAAGSRLPACTPKETEDELPPSNRCTGGYMSTDSEDTDDFHVVRTLRHYRRGQSSSSSECSCESCISHSDESFFENEEGPPMGETSAPRRTFVWLENIREKWGFLVLGLLVMSLVLCVAGLVVTEMLPTSEISRHMLYWTLPLVVVCGLCVTMWRAARYLLLRGGYGKGGHIMERRNLILDAQAKELVYTVRGVIYAPTCHNSPGCRSPPVYEVVAYENEFNPNTYIDSDLEHDGQYRNSLTSGQEDDNPHAEEECSIYSRRAWFRDVPLVWWELLPSNHKDL